jgi:hypothetical protein
MQFITPSLPKSWELLTINFGINATRGAIPRFYNFRTKRLQDDYIKLCKPKTYMAIQKKAWMTSLLFKEFPYFFKKFIQGGMSFTNMHLFVLDWHDKHVTLKVIVMHKIFG